MCWKGNRDSGKSLERRYSCIILDAETASHSPLKPWSTQKGTSGLAQISKRTEDMELHCCLTKANSPHPTSFHFLTGVESLLPAVSSPYCPEGGIEHCLFLLWLSLNQWESVWEPLNGVVPYARWRRRLNCKPQREWGKQPPKTKPRPFSMIGGEKGVAYDSSAKHIPWCKC